MNSASRALRRTMAPLTLTLLVTGAAHAQNTSLLTLPTEKPIKGMSWASLSPDAKTVAFTYGGDIWTVASDGGVATRLTVHEAVDALSRWSPDGKFIAYSSLRNGNYDIYLVPAQGGQSRQVTSASSNDWIDDWSPDGKKLLFYSQRDTKTFALFTIDLLTKAVKKVADDTEALRFAAWSPDGKEIAYSRAGQPWWRPWYKGTVAAQTVVKNLETGKVKTLYKNNLQQLWPLWSGDSKSVYVTMLAGNNTPNLFRLPSTGGSPVQLTRHTKDAVRWPSISRNGSAIVYTLDGDLYLTDTKTGTSKQISVIARTDDKINNQERQVLTNGVAESEPSPDGKQVAFVLKGELWLVPTGNNPNNDTKRLTDEPGNDNDIVWSPDGKKIAFVSDRGNQPDLYLMDVATKTVSRLTNDIAAETAPQFSPDSKWVSFAKAGSTAGLYAVPAAGGTAKLLAAGNGNNNFGVGISSHAWSPDSKFVAFTRMDRYENTDVWLLNVSVDKSTAVNVSKHPEGNENPQFTKDGNTLFFISGRNGGGLYSVPLQEPDDQVDEKDADGKPKPKPDHSKDVKVDFDDISLRAKLISAGVSDYSPTPDSKLVVLRQGAGFFSVPLAGGTVTPIAATEPGGNIRVTSDSTKFYYIGAGGTIRSLPVAGGAPTTVAFSAIYTFDRKLQYQQAFNEFYRRYGQAFYDATMHGTDWKQLRDQFEPQLSGAGTPEEFANILSEMVGAVNGSHSEISPASKVGGPQTATLGLFYDETYTGPGLKVKGVMPKGPADKPSTKVKPGDYLLAIDGTDIKGLTEDYYSLLLDKAAKPIEITVNSKPAKDGARTFKIKPITTAEWGELEYERMVRDNRARVDKLSGGKLAYLHIRAMNGPSLQRFNREFAEEALGKEGLVLDIRGNGGGNTHDAILNVLSRKVYGFTQPRDGLRMSQPEKAITKPIILLIDQNAYSDGEIFPAGFRALNLGKIVGVATPGYVIGTYGGTLVDGTGFRLPSWGWYTADGKNMENLGIPPDIFVDKTAEDVAADRDPQIEKAVQLALSAKYEGVASPTDVTTTVASPANDNSNGGSAGVSSGKRKR